MDVYRYGDLIALSGVGGATVYFRTDDARKLRDALSHIVKDISEKDFTDSDVPPIHVTPHMTR